MLVSAHQLPSTIVTCTYLIFCQVRELSGLLSIVIQDFERDASGGHTGSAVDSVEYLSGWEDASPIVLNILKVSLQLSYRLMLLTNL